MDQAVNSYFKSLILQLLKDAIPDGVKLGHDIETGPESTGLFNIGQLNNILHAYFRFHIMGQDKSKVLIFGPEIRNLVVIGLRHALQQKIHKTVFDRPLHGESPFRTEHVIAFDKRVNQRRQNDNRLDAIVSFFQSAQTVSVLSELCLSQTKVHKLIPAGSVKNPAVLPEHPGILLQDRTPLLRTGGVHEFQGIKPD